MVTSHSILADYNFLHLPFPCWTETIIKPKAFIVHWYWICIGLSGNWRCSADPNYHWLLQCMEFVSSVGSNKAWSHTALMGAGLHSCVLFDLIEAYLKVSLVNCRTGSCSLSHHTLVCACASVRVYVRTKTSGCTHGCCFKVRSYFFLKRKRHIPFT